jgi:hypothetical protein
VYLADDWSNHEVIYTTPTQTSSSVSLFGAAGTNGLVGPRTLTVIDSGNLPLGITTIESSAGFPVSSGTCANGSVVNPGYTCAVGISYQPNGATSLATGSLVLTVAATTGPNPDVFPLSGGSGAVLLSPTPVSFGDVVDNDGASAPMTITLANGTSGAVAVGNPTITGSAGFSVLSNACPASLAAGASCGLQAVFTPTIAGAASATLKIAGVSTTLLANGSLWTPDAINFHNVTWNSTSRIRTVTVFNPGATAESIGGIALSSGTGFTISGTTCSNSIAAHSSCTVSIVFAPQASDPQVLANPQLLAGPLGFSAYLSFTLNGVDRTSVVELSGVAVPASVTNNTTPDAFQMVSAGTFTPAGPTGVTGVTVSFGGVTTAGVTSAALLPAGYYPSGFAIANNPLANLTSAQFFDVTTSATGSGPYTVCFTVPAGTAAGSLDVYHYEMTYDATLSNGNGGWAVEYVLKPLLPSASSSSSLCVQTATLSPFVVAGRLSIGAFAAFSQDFTWLRANATVTSGNIGANVSRASMGHAHTDDGDTDDLTVLVGVGASMPAGSLVAGDTVDLKTQSSVYNVAGNYSVVAKKATVAGRISTPFPLPLFATMPAFPTVSPGSAAVYVPKNQTMTLAAGSYGTLHVDNGGTLILTGGLYQFASVQVDQNATVLFRAASQVRVQTELGTLANSKLIVDPTVGGLRASQIVFYVQGTDANCSASDGDNDGDDAGPVTAHIGSNSTVQANIYATNGTVWLKSGTQATGAFLGVHVRIGINATLTLDSAFK